MSKKPKPATAGERIFLRLIEHIYFPQLTDGHRFNLTDLRNGGYLCAGTAYLAIDRAIARAVKKERLRCTRIALENYSSRRNGWSAWQDIVNGGDR